MGSSEKEVDILVQWTDIADLDGFDIGYVESPGSFGNIVNLLIPKLRRFGRSPDQKNRTLQERSFGRGQARLGQDYPGSKWKFNIYSETS